MAFALSARDTAQDWQKLQCMRKSRAVQLEQCAFIMQVLVIYLGDARFKWLPKQELLPFAKHKQQKVAEAQALIAFKQLTKPILFNKALKVWGLVCIYPTCPFIIAHQAHPLCQGSQGSRCPLALNAQARSLMLILHLAEAQTSNSSLTKPSRYGLCSCLP